MAHAPLSVADRRLLWSKMRTPLLAFAALIVLLAGIVLMGSWLPFRSVWIMEAMFTVAMIGIVLVFSMELPSEPPIIRFFAIVGFFWVAILFTMTLVDYLTR